VSVWAAPVAAAQPVPKVVLVVGPVGSITPAYRALANEAADAARNAGAEVVKVYSPDATWPAVREALDGASIVVYLGHGNGWPSRYRNSLYPPTQNGFGLNPTGGNGDDSHQYFGEASIEKLHLAPNAVVVFSHLCYASGNSEPGLPEGSVSDAIQRVDNYASGFLRAGAKAVVAEAGLGPAYYVRSLLRTGNSIEQIWRQSPTYNGNHQIVVRSERTNGYTVRLDPERATSLFRRSLVSRGVTASELRASAQGRAGRGNTVAVMPSEPSLATAGLRFGEPQLHALPIASSASRLTLPLPKARSSGVPKGAQVSVRWDAIQLDAPAAPDPSTIVGPVPEPTTVPSGVAARRHGTEADPGAVPDPAAEPTPAPEDLAPEVDLVVPEAMGSVVEPVAVRLAKHGLVLDVAYPTEPGLYRLTFTLHTPEGVAYDAATQALLAPVLVRVGGALAVAYGAPQTLALATGSSNDVAIRVLNAGSSSWAKDIPAPRAQPSNGGSHTTGRTKTILPSLVATWVSTDGHEVPSAVTVKLDKAVADPGGSSVAVLSLEAPSVAGTYLLLLDVVTPDYGALSAKGSTPALVRVTVGEPVAPAVIAPTVQVPVITPDTTPVASPETVAPVTPVTTPSTDHGAVITLPLLGDD
jgi:hypothetical protein